MTETQQAKMLRYPSFTEKTGFIHKVAKEKTGEQITNLAPKMSFLSFSSGSFSGNGDFFAKSGQPETALQNM